MSKIKIFKKFQVYRPLHKFVCGSMDLILLPSWYELRGCWQESSSTLTKPRERREKSFNGKKLIKLFPPKCAQKMAQWIVAICIYCSQYALAHSFAGGKLFWLLVKVSILQATLSHIKDLEGKICNQDIIKSRHHHNKSLSHTFHAQKYCWWEVLQGMSSFWDNFGNQ